MELGRNIHLIPEIRGANTYVVLGDTQIGGGGHLILIDTGMPGNASRMVEFLKSLGKEQMGSFTIILTHPDIDHSGSVANSKRSWEP
jgi:glyoxylase-like metal-dependent hydrolase (beta-lactamase superfamily II)